MELLNLLKSNEQRRTESMWARYAALLEAERHDKKSITELEECMQALGKSAADAEDDMLTLRTLRETQRTIQDGACLDEAEVKARTACNEYRVETERLMAQRRQEWERLDRAHTVILNRQTNARRATLKMEELRQQHPQLVLSVTEKPA